MLDVYVSTITENRMVFFNRETMWVSNIVQGRLKTFYAIVMTKNQTTYQKMLLKRKPHHRVFLTPISPRS